MAAQPPIDRQATVPFLLRLFYKKGEFHRLEEFATPDRLPLHVQIYTWHSADLQELTKLLLTALPSLLPADYAGTRIAFRHVFADLNAGRYMGRDLGSVIVGAKAVESEAELAGKVSDMDLDTAEEVAEKEEAGDEAMDTDTPMPEADDPAHALKQLSGEVHKSLQDARFVVGDYITAAILPPLADGSVAASPPPPSGPARGAPPRDTYDSYNSRPGPRDNGFGGRGGGDFYRGGGRGGRGGARFDDARHGGAAGNFPQGEWRRGEAPPAPEREAFAPRGRGREREREQW